MGAHVGGTEVNLAPQNGICNSRALILCLANRENCPNLSYTRVVVVIGRPSA